MPRGDLVPREQPLVRELISWLRDLVYGFRFISDELADFAAANLVGVREETRSETESRPSSSRIHLGLG